MQETVRIASNLYAKKQCKMLEFSADFALFLAYKVGALFSVFLQENLLKIVWQCCIFFKLFRDDFHGTVCRDGKGGIPVKSRPKCGDPDRDCTGKTRICSAMSTKSEIEMKGWKCDGFFLYFSSFFMMIFNENVC